MIFLDKLFPRINKVNIDNLKINNECLSYITTPDNASQISLYISKHIIPYKHPKDVVIIDAMACVGGDSIIFCSIFGSVISIEIDKLRYENLKNNLEEYKFKNYNILNGDCLAIIPKITNADIIYFDPPWGGKDYKSKINLKLIINENTNMSIEIEQLILNCFNNNITPNPPKFIAIKLPKNYDLKYFYEKISTLCNIYYYEIKKLILLIVEIKKVS